jgi:two-component system copper resistance phosphate regulon response regulator CusR
VSTVLVIEDEPRLRGFLVRLLEREGHAVTSAASGPEGVQRATEEDVDVVILDLMLPGYDGFEVLRRVLEHDPNQMVVVASAVGDVASRVRCLEMGAADYLAKPFASAELMARIRARLRPVAAAGRQRWLTVGDVVLDQERQTLTVAGREVVLSHREFVLLAHLMRRAGSVCTRDELLSGVWGMTFDPGSNVVDVYVRRVRTKLKLQRIETVRNVGYAFVAS